MKKSKWLLLALILFGYAQNIPSACAALKPGDNAPDFTIAATQGGNRFSFSLSGALKHGPVVLYFYPAAFTQGCTIEAHDFAEAIDRFKAFGATVIGISNDSIDTLDKFSVSECHRKFAVGADEDAKVMKAYDAVLISHTGIADRISYVITPDYKIDYAYAALNPDDHVKNTLEALAKWDAQNR